MTATSDSSVTAEGTTSGRSSSATESTTTSTSSPDDVVSIAADGDLVLRIDHQATTLKHSASFRVSTSALKQYSKYFERLLEAGRFGEGSAVQAQHENLRERYGSIAEAPTLDLPVVTTEDLGRISTVKSIVALCTDLLLILHGKDTLSQPPVANLANLAIVADRFDVLDAIKAYTRRKRMIRAIDGKTTAKQEIALAEEKVRQRLLVAIMLDYPPWIERYSARLIMKGWVGTEADVLTALWWDLPSRFEEELACRREYVLETVQSLQSYFLSQYTSRERMCKLGYDSSGQCDSFQLGEMIRFFMRTGTLQLHGSILDTIEPSAPFPGDVQALIDTLRQVPEYQIDRNHTHCGLRTRIVPLLDLIQDALQHVGVCAECWTEDRLKDAWMEAKRPLRWARSGLRSKSQGHRHAEYRAMFMASERDWGA